LQSLNGLGFPFAAALGLPILFAVFNTGGWHAVRSSTRGMFRVGHAASTPPATAEPLADFGFDLHSAKVMDTVGGHGERVEHPDELPKALARTQNIIRNEGRQVLPDVVCTT
jgi:acetolactate synthase-1/2/3 large subunit